MLRSAAVLGGGSGVRRNHKSGAKRCSKVASNCARRSISISLHRRLSLTEPVLLTLTSQWPIGLDIFLMGLRYK
jgi:hypothetical protein